MIGRKVRVRGDNLFKAEDRSKNLENMYRKRPNLCRTVLVMVQPMATKQCTGSCMNQIVPALIVVELHSRTLTCPKYAHL